MEKKNLDWTNLGFSYWQTNARYVSHYKNGAWVPPYGTGATLYLRPYMLASSPVTGIKSAEEYQFRLLCTPVGPYFKGGSKPLTLCVSDFDRAAPHGTGHIKAGLNTL